MHFKIKNTCKLNNNSSQQVRALKSYILASTDNDDE
jgi:hypothetical protein